MVAEVEAAGEVEAIGVAGAGAQVGAEPEAAVQAPVEADKARSDLVGGDAADGFAAPPPPPGLPDPPAAGFAGPARRRRVCRPLIGSGCTRGYSVSPLRGSKMQSRLGDIERPRRTASPRRQTTTDRLALSVRCLIRPAPSGRLGNESPGGAKQSSREVQPRQRQTRRSSKGPCAHPTTLTRRDRSIRSAHRPLDPG